MLRLGYFGLLIPGRCLHRARLEQRAPHKHGQNISYMDAEIIGSYFEEMLQTLWPFYSATLERFTTSPGRNFGSKQGFDHGAGHPLLFLDDAKAPNYRKNNGFKDLGNYFE